MKKVFFLLILIFLNFQLSSAEELRLKNGDRITGAVIERTDKEVVIQTQAMGRITVQKAFIKEDAPAEEQTAAPGSDVEWARKAALGYSRSSGNTESSQFSGEVSLSRKTGHDEWSAAYKSYLTTDQKKMNKRQFYASLRYAYSFGRDLSWYHFFKMEGDQDRFANIDYRLVPSSGVGYWFSNEESFKLMAETALGYEHTHYYDGTESDGSAVVVPRGFLEKKFANDLVLKEDVTLYGPLEDFSGYRLRSETSCSGPLSEKMSWRVSFIDDYNASPSAGTKKNDYKIISAIDVSF